MEANDCLPKQENGILKHNMTRLLLLISAVSYYQMLAEDKELHFTRSTKCIQTFYWFTFLS